MARVFATVGMGPWPFDRLIDALEPVSEHHEVFAQIGTADRTPTYPHRRFIGAAEFDRRLAEADIVITHAGNTVRVAQRRGQVPITVAREAARGEMANDHQVWFVAHERDRSPMITLTGDLADLAATVDDFASLADRVRHRPVPETASPGGISGRLAPLWRDTPRTNPVADDPTRRLSWSFAQVAGLDGPHLDVGCGAGRLVAALAEYTDRTVIGVDPSPRPAGRNGRLVRTGAKDPLPFAAGAFTSVSMLDVLEHVWDEQAVLAEVRRVLVPGGRLVVTVPRRHWLSFLDPDNAKFRWPRLHRLVYRARFGSSTYRRRFEDLDDGMRGDLAIERNEHHHYEAKELFGCLDRAGFDVIACDAANLFWRLADVPRLLLPQPIRTLTHPILRTDARWFHQANLFVVAEARPRCDPTVFPERPYDRKDRMTRTDDAGLEPRPGRPVPVEIGRPGRPAGSPRPARPGRTDRAVRTWRLARFVARLAIKERVRPSLPVRPLVAELFLTDNCNLTCTSCACWREHTRNELSTEEWCQVVDQLADLGFIKLNFTGGEALIRRDAAVIMAHARARGIADLHLNTNGILLDDRRLAEVISAGVTSFNISVDGPDPASHDAIRGLDGAFATTVEAIRRVTAYGPEVAVRMNFTVLAGNAHHLPAMADLAETLGVSLYLNLGTDTTFLFRHPDVTAQLDVDETVLRDALADLERRVRGGSRRLPPVRALRYIPGHFELEPASTVPCAESQLKLMIRSSGQIGGCWGHDGTLNVRDRSIRSVIDDPAYREEHDRFFRKDCVQCGSNYALNLKLRPAGFLDAARARRGDR
ncbi:MAG: radical SAM protein [Acidimicrobiales bacterium]